MTARQIIRTLGVAACLTGAVLTLAGTHGADATLLTAGGVVIVAAIAALGTAESAAAHHDNDDKEE